MKVLRYQLSCLALSRTEQGENVASKAQRLGARDWPGPAPAGPRRPSLTHLCGSIDRWTGLRSYVRSCGYSTAMLPPLPARAAGVRRARGGATGFCGFRERLRLSRRCVFMGCCRTKQHGAPSVVDPTPQWPARLLQPGSYDGL